MELSGRSAIVTGGASGIGAAVTAALRRSGVRVAVLDRETEGADADLIIACDVSQESQLERAVAHAAESLGGLDLAFVNAGVVSMGSVLELPMKEWDRVMDVNLRGAFMTLQQCGRAIRETGRGGAMVATTSSAALVADVGIAHYSVSKIGLTHLVRVAARELGPYGIRVNAVAPGPTLTPMQAGSDAFPGFPERMIEWTPLGRLGQPDDIADAVLALFCLDWVTGQTLACDGGITLHSPTDTLGL